MATPLRPVWFALGWFFVATGVIGVFLPVLPTTPFMLLALWMFSRSSQRFHDWLYNHRLFGPPLQKWQEHRVIPLGAKMASISMMSASLIYLILFRDLPFWVMGLTAALMLYAAWFILTKPSSVSKKSGSTD